MYGGIVLQHARRMQNVTKLVTYIYKQKELQDLLIDIEILVVELPRKHIPLMHLLKK